LRLLIANGVEGEHLKAAYAQRCGGLGIGR
jgi:hypothetical protein